MIQQLKSTEFSLSHMDTTKKIAKLRTLLKRGETAEARLLALEIEANHYPKTLKAIAEQCLHEIGRGGVDDRNEYTERLYQIAAVNNKAVSKENPATWLPWRIICDLLGLTGTREDIDVAQKRYTDDYLSSGINTINYIKKLPTACIAEALRPYFDASHYRDTSPDLCDQTDEQALLHYSKHGWEEENRQPNKLFANEDFFALYPWTRSVGVNIFYLYVRWTEQFPEYSDLLQRKYAITSNQLPAPWKRTTTSLAEQDWRERSEYFRILDLTKEISSKSRRIACNAGTLNIHFVVPDFSEGSGGHMTIFRLIMHLEKAGHTCTVWIKDMNFRNHRMGPEKTVSDYYQPVKAKIFPLSSHFCFSFGDALIATGWDTVELVLAHKSFHDHFYLVQDYEPYFYARGAESLEAESTYRARLKTICASQWLHEIMERKYGRKSIAFALSFDSAYYYPPKYSAVCNIDSPNGALAENIRKTNERPLIRIALYARLSTKRRAVELAIRALALVDQSQYILCIELFGSQRGSVSLPSTVLGYDNGILSPEELGKLYRACDIGLTFSATNHALVPQEMMACGLPVIEIDNESTRCVYPDDAVYLSRPSPADIAKAISFMAANASQRRKYSINGLKWVNHTSWEASFRRVESFIKTEVARSDSESVAFTSIDKRYATLRHEVLRKSEKREYTASVIIPSFQGGQQLCDTVNRVLGQQAPFDFEVIVIDSSSTDGSIDRLRDSANNLSIYRVKKEDFQHGRTRNLGVALASSEYIAFLTQDALPATDNWLASFVRIFIENSKVDAAFGRHCAHPGHPTYLEDQLTEHFASFKSHFFYSKSTAPAGFHERSPSIRQLYHFYSDNNSCLRKSAWRQFPYHDVGYGEDQLWADWIIQSGGVKAYVPEAVVYHSHDYSEAEEFKRAETEAFFFAKYFGYTLIENRFGLEASLEANALRIINNKFGACNDEVHTQLLRLRARLEGHWHGCNTFKRSLLKSLRD